MTKGTLFILGGTGFIGQETVAEALKAGWEVKALVRSPEKAGRLAQIGASVITGDVARPEAWIDAVQGSKILIDLTQPALPKRLTVKAIQKVSIQRQQATAKFLQALTNIGVENRPLYFSISGADDLQPVGGNSNAPGRIDHNSPLRQKARGFAHIGLPVRRLIEDSPVAATYIYFGNLVYGPGKIFAEQYLKGLSKGTARLLGSGSNHLPLVHVRDAARALVHLAGLPLSDLSEQTLLVMDGSNATQRELLDETADQLGVKRPGNIPKWLAALAAGSVAVETLTLDVQADPSALLATGFRFQYPSIRAGIAVTLAQFNQSGEAAGVLAEEA
ncbi:MAG TPA: DUF1731 domain-containing protein [Chloroflexia bacterium]|nr:DUF1731 domain-containing protein [Chloroflexia bacterium]